MTVNNSEKNTCYYIIEKSFSIIIWVVLVIIANIIHSNSIYAEYEPTIEIWKCVQFLLFLKVGILLLLQAITMNIKLKLKCFEEYKDFIIICLAVIIIILSIGFYRDFIDFTKLIASYGTAIRDKYGILGIESVVLFYNRQVFLYAIISSVLAIANTIVVIKEIKMNRKK